MEGNDRTSKRPRVDQFKQIFGRAHSSTSGLLSDTLGVETVAIQSSSEHAHENHTTGDLPIPGSLDGQPEPLLPSSPISLISDRSSQCNHITSDDSCSSHPPTNYKPLSASTSPVSPSTIHPSFTRAHTIQTASPSQRDPGGLVWPGLEVLLNALNDATGVFSPLKSAVEGLSKCIEIFENEAAVRKEYAELRDILNGFCRDLARFIEAGTPPSMTRSVKTLADDLKKEAEVVMKQYSKRKISRLVEASENRDALLECYRRINTCLGRLVLNSDMNIWRIVDEQATVTRLKDLPDSLAGRYSSPIDARGLRRNACTRGTRTDVLRSLQSWAEQKDGQTIFWLNGMAGTGKTTIAYSACEFLERSGRLAASFFCSRQLPECKEVNRIIPSIAYQLSLVSRPFRHSLSTVLEQQPEAYNRPIKEQLTRLVLEPLMKCEKTFPENLVVVIDALDECEHQDGVGNLLSALLDFSCRSQVKFLLTSRPYPTILDRLDNIQAAGVRSVIRLHDLDKGIVKADIKTYLIDGLSDLELSPAEVDTLVEQSGGFFIYAATVVRYTSNGFRAQRMKRLRQVLSISPGTPGGKIGEEIDQLYVTVLETALEDSRLESWEIDDVIMALRTIICAQEPLSLTALAGLLKLEDEELVQAALGRLLSVIHVDATTGKITTLHESFPEFLQDRMRSSRFHCDPALHHGWLARRCLQQINESPSFNICGLESSFVLDREVPELKKRIDRSISASLSYSCRYWESHLELSLIDSEVHALLFDFMMTRLLMWMEVMNLTGKIYEGTGVMHKLHAMLLRTKGSRRLIDLSEDAWRFISRYTSDKLNLRTPHLYVSLLAFWPEERPISIYYAPWRTGLVRMTGPGLSRRNQEAISIYDTTVPVSCVAYSPGNDVIGCGLKSGGILLWNVHTSQPIRKSFEGHSALVTSLSFSPNGARIVSSSHDGTARVWDVLKGQMIGRPFNGHKGFVSSVKFSPDGQHIASSSEDRTIRVWSTLSGQVVGQTLRGHTHYVYSVAFSPDGQRIVSGSFDRTIRLWDVLTGQMVGQPFEGHKGFVSSVEFSPDGQHILSGSEDRTIRIWDVLTGQMVGQPLEGHSHYVSSIAFSPNGQQVVSGSEDRTIRIWNALNGQMVGQPLEGHSHYVSSVAFSPDSQHIVSGSKDGTIRVWRVLTNHTAGKPLDGHNSCVSSVAFSPNGQQVVSGSEDRTIRIWNALTGQMIGKPLEGHSHYVSSLAFSSDSRLIVSGSFDRTIRVWDALAGRMLGRPLEGHKGFVSSISLSIDGRRIVSGSEEKTVRIWDVLTGQMIGQPLEGHSHYVSSVAFSPNGRHIASGSEDRTVRVWDVLTGRMIGQPLEGHRGYVYSVAFSPDGHHIASGSLDSTIRVWDLLTSRMVGQPFEGHSHCVYSIAFSPDGQRIVSGSFDRTIRVWDVLTGQMLGQPFDGHSRYIFSVAFSPDSQRIVSGSEDNTIRIWDLCPTNPTLDCGDYSNWMLNKDGWIFDRNGMPLVWVPPELRPILLRPRNPVLVGNLGYVKLDFSKAKLGLQWAGIKS